MKPLASIFRPALVPLALISTALAAQAWAAPEAGPGYRIEQLVPGSPFCGVHGLGIDAQDRLYAGSVAGARLYRVDTEDGSVSTEVPPPKGMADDMEFLPDGTLVWTSINQNAVRARKPGGEVYDLATDLVSVNSIAYRESDGRLFVSQVFGGDGLWELDPEGKKPRRLILDNPGGLNGFDIGPDGMIYGPLWFKKKVVKIDPDSGAMSTVAEGFQTPAAVNFDSNWNLYVLDTATGEVFKVDIESGKKEVFARLKPSLDNLAIDSRDRIYVSNMADNSIHRIDAKTGKVETVVPGGLSCAYALDAAGDTLYLADVFALRSIDGESGKVTDIGRAHQAGQHIGYPVGIAVGDRNFYSVASEGFLQVYNRQSNELQKEWHGLPGLQQVIELENGDLLALSDMGKQLTRLNGDNYDKQTVIATDLSPLGDMVAAGDGMVYATQPSANAVIRIDLAGGKRETISSQLQQPRGIDLLPDGSLVIMETGGRIVSLDPGDADDVSLVGKDIPVGQLNPALGIQSPGVAVGSDGTVYAISDRENAIYRISGKNTEK